MHFFRVLGTISFVGVYSKYISVDPFPSKLTQVLNLFTKKNYWGRKAPTLSHAPIDYAHAFTEVLTINQQCKIICWYCGNFRLSTLLTLSWFQGYHTYSCASGSNNTSNNNHKSNIVLNFVFSSRAVKFDLAKLTYLFSSKFL